MVSYLGCDVSISYETYINYAVKIMKILQLIIIV